MPKPITNLEPWLDPELRAVFATRELMRERWQAYLGEHSDPSPYAAPARASNLSRLPPAVILAAELDPLRDEAVDYATRWHAAVSCELRVLRGAIHGCDAIAPDSTVARAALSWTIEHLRALHRPAEDSH